jgi:hypothetical protein
MRQIGAGTPMIFIIESAKWVFDRFQVRGREEEEEDEEEEEKRRGLLDVVQLAFCHSTCKVGCR